MTANQTKVKPKSTQSKSFIHQEFADLIPNLPHPHIPQPQPQHAEDPILKANRRALTHTYTYTNVHA